MPILKKIKKKKRRLTLSQNKDISIEDLKHRKERLKKEIDSLESNMDDSFTKVKKNTIGSVSLSSGIKKNPFKAVGLSVLVGIAIGFTGKKSPKKSVQNNNKYGFGTLLWDEMKRLAARRATEYITTFVDSEITPRVLQKFDKHDNNTTKKDR